MKKIILKKSFLKREYITNDKSMAKISRLLNCSYGVVKRNLLFYEIYIRNNSESKIGNRNPFWKKGKPKCKNCKKILSRYDAKFCNNCLRGKLHHNYKHGNSQKKKPCNICKKNLVSFRSKICKKCFFKFFNRGSKHPNWKNGKPKCIQCAKPLFHYETKSCRKCYLIYLRNRKGEKSPVWKGGKPHCKICEKQIGYYSTVCRSCLSYKFRLKNNPNWHGGKSFEPYPLGWNRTFKEQIRYRDKYICQLCGVPEAECSRRLHVHHTDYNKDNLKENNLLSLCMSCHMKTNKNREFWTKFFSEIMENKYAINV